MTQQETIINILKSGVELTSLDGLKIGIIRVTNRINELRELGYKIKDRWLVSDNGARYKSYYIDSTDCLLLSN